MSVESLPDGKIMAAGVAAAPQKSISLRRYLATSDRAPAVLARRLLRAFENFSLPAPRVLVVPMQRIFLLIRAVYYFLWRVFVCEPFFKAHCTKYGKNLHTGVYLHWMEGKGEIVLGDNVLIDGKCTIKFAARYSDTPRLTVGDNSGIGHGTALTIGKGITIGNNCRISSQVYMFDAPGHPSDPGARLSNEAVATDDVRPITIGNNVWIGYRAIIFPGVTIGDGSVVSIGSVVMQNVPGNTLVAGNPARQVRTLQVIGEEAR